jgi:hypothetical protein
MIKVFGKRPTGKRLSKISESLYYSSGGFKNIEETSLNPNNVSMLKILKDFCNKPKTVMPGITLPNVKTDLFRLATEKPFSSSDLTILHTMKSKSMSLQ